MKNKHIFFTGIATLALVFITFLAGCSSLLPGLFPNSGTSAPRVNYVPDGTYTYYPRLRAMQAGVDKNAYIAKIVATGGNLAVYVSNVPLAEGGYYSIEGYWNTAILQDLDNPSRSYNPTNSTREDSFHVVSYQGVSARRFSLTTSSNPPLIFEEVVIGEPDQPDTRDAVANGTYTYYPRLRAMQGGVDKNAYIAKIVVRGGYLNVYVSNVPQGTGGYYSIEGGWSTAILQDLDKPSIALNPSNSTREDSFQVVSYQISKGSRFSLETGSTPPHVFDEIILGEPDAQ
jgi:hypothetical protein